MKKDAIIKIMSRVDAISKEIGTSIIMDYGKASKMTLLMDLDCLNERELLMLSQLEDESFIHDIIGIQNNINRTTRKLENLFVPRCVDAIKCIDTLNNK